jgi:hypothetical protein
MGNSRPDLEKLVRDVTGCRAAHARERVQSLWRGYGEIRRFTLEGGPAPRVVVKHVAPPRLAAASAEQARSHARKLRSYEVECAFYLAYAARCTRVCRVPRAYHAAPRGDGFLFVLEDLDAAGFPGRRGLLTLDELRRCLAWLAHFHAGFLSVAPDGLWPEGTYWQLDTRPDELARLNDPALGQAAAELDARLRNARFRSLVHGDAKLENFCFGSAGEVAAVDFQYAGGGVGVKDVAYFLASCLDGAACEAHADALLEDYLAMLTEAVRAVDPALDAAALAAEWRALYPLAWADFTRFLLGWAPEEAAAHAYGLRLTREVLAAL